MEFAERVLLLRVGKFKESDLWVRFLSPTRGLLTGFAFGGSRSRRRFVGCLDTFNEVHLKVASSGRGSYLLLQEGVLVNSVSRLRGDLPRLGMAANCAAFLQSFGVSPEGAAQAHFLMREFLRLLEERDEAIFALLPFLFRARMAFDQGYALESGRCSVCGASLGRDGACLFLQEGRLACPACSRKLSGQRFFLGEQSLNVLTLLPELPPLAWPELWLPPASSRECARAIDEFIRYHVGISWEHGRFVRQ